MLAAGNVSGDDGWLDISFTSTAKPSVQNTTASATTTCQSVCIAFATLPKLQYLVLDSDPDNLSGSPAFSRRADSDPDGHSGGPAFA